MREPWSRMSETQRFLLLSILIGVFTGLLIVCFHIAIDFVTWHALGSLSGRFDWRRLIWPVLGAAAATMIVGRIFLAAKGSGVNQTKAAFYVSDGYVSPGAMVGKFAACSISIGSGNSLGPEDPALHMGAGVASLLGRLFGLERKSMRLVAPVGAAAGIGAAFNTPITGVLFVMEEVIASWTASVLGSILLAAVSAVVVVRWFLGGEPLFRVPPFQLRHPSELLVYAALGVAGGVLAAVFIKGVAWARARLERLPRRAQGYLPLAAGFLVGVAGQWMPEVMGAGYDAIDSALHERFPAGLLLGLGLMKMAVTLIAFSSGVPGGMFAPTLFTGAMIGGGLGTLASRYWPFPSGSAEAYVLVGMGTFFAGVFRAPMTAIFMVFEVSASYVIILPMMVAGTISYFVSRQLQPVPFFSMLARHEGLDLPSADEYRAVESLRVEDAMQPPGEAVLEPETAVGGARELAARSGAKVWLVKLGEAQWSSATLEQLNDGEPDAPLKGVLPLAPHPRLYPDLPLDAALRFLAVYPVIPVVSRSDPGILLGAITLDGVHQAYGILPKPPGSGQSG